MDILFSILPVSVFVFLLYLMDTFKLVEKKTILKYFAIGMLAGVCAYILNTYLINNIAVDYTGRKVFYALTEELIKSVIIISIFKNNRFGFLIDTLIFCFTIGAGFAFLENIYYYLITPNANISLQIIRGFGTAIMHSMSCSLIGMLLFTYGYKLYKAISIFLVAFVFHYLYNLFLIPVYYQVVVVFSLFILITYFIFAHNEKQINKWLSEEMDLEMDLLLKIRSGEFSDTLHGKFILNIRERFQPLVVFDMICLIRLSLELSMQLKAEMLIESVDIDIPQNDELMSRFREFNHLKNNIGKTGLAAIKPLLFKDKKLLWKLNKIQEKI